MEKIVLTKMEYDLIEYHSMYGRHKFRSIKLLDYMKYKGYFEGIKDTNIIIYDILDNCNVRKE